MYLDAMDQARNCPQGAIVEGTGKKVKPPLFPIPTERPFQIVGADNMDSELPVTLLSIRSISRLIYQVANGIPGSDQKAECIARLLVENILPFFGVPEALLSDGGTNLLSWLIKDVCGMLGIKNLILPPVIHNVVELWKGSIGHSGYMIRKYAVKFRVQWDQYISMEYSGQKERST